MSNFVGENKRQHIFVNGHKISRGYVGNRQNFSDLLPIGFRELEYIESTGAQYIDTGLKGNLDTSVELSVNQVAPSTTSTITVFGDNTTKSSALSLNLETIDSGGRNSRFGDKIVTTTGTHTNIVHSVRMDKNSLIVDGNILGNFNTTTQFTTTANLTYGKTNGLNSTYYDGTADLYQCKIYDGTNLIRNFIPAKRVADGEIGLYDIVGGHFYINQGTGSFIAGPEV